MGRDAGLFVLAGGSVARPTRGRAIEPDRPRTLSEGRARPSAIQRTGLMTSIKAKRCFCIWRHGRQMFILSHNIAHVSALRRPSYLGKAKGQM